MHILYTGKFNISIFVQKKIILLVASKFVNQMFIEQDSPPLNAPLCGFTSIGVNDEIQMY